MERTIYQNFLDIDKEEEFINLMCKDGWKIKDKENSFIYKFSKCIPEEYICKIVCLSVEKNESIDNEKNSILREELEEEGAEIITPTSNKRVIYALKKKELGKFKIDLDINFKIKEYKRRKKYYEKMMAFCVLFGYVFLKNIIIISIIEYCLALIYLFKIFKVNEAIKKLVYKG